MSELKLKMPISIEPSTADKGYVITDANNTEHFFYEENGELVYDGWCAEVKTVFSDFEDKVDELKHELKKSE